MENIALTSLEERAMELLGDGHSQEVVASTLGVTPARVTQMMSQDWFAAEVSKLRFQNLQEATQRDRKLDKIEDRLIDKIDKSLNLIHKPGDLIRAFKEINGARRRGSPVDTTAALINQTVVNLTIPAAAVNKYRSNEHSQVIEVNDKPFLTAPTNLLPEIAKSHLKGKDHDSRQETTGGTVSIKGQAISPADI